MAADLQALREFGRSMAESTPQMAALGAQFVDVEPGVGLIRVPWRADLVGDPDTGVIASGVITTLLDHACGLAIKAAREDFSATATLDLRIDYMRPARVGEMIYGRAHCYKQTKSVAFLRAVAYETDPDDPIATAQGAFMLAGSPV